MSYSHEDHDDFSARADAIAANAARAWERPDPREDSRAESREDECAAVFARADAIAAAADRAWMREDAAPVALEVEPVRVQAPKAVADGGEYVDPHGNRWRSRNDYDRASDGCRQ